jgi:hypothetical protein
MFVTPYLRFFIGSNSPTFEILGRDGDHWRPDDRFPADQHRLWAGTGGHDLVKEPVGIRLQPGNVAVRRRGIPGIGWTRDLRRQHPPWVAPKQIQAGVRGDAVQPGAERGTSLEGLAFGPGPQEGLLDQVLGVLRRAGEPVNR